MFLNIKNIFVRTLFYFYNTYFVLKNGIISYGHVVSNLINYKSRLKYRYYIYIGIVSCYYQRTQER